MDFLKDLMKVTGNQYASIVADGVEAADVDTFIDSGSYMLNAMMSGSIYGGFPNNKITVLGGESSTGKTYFILSVVKKYLEDNPKGGVIYFESESAVSKKMIEERGIDSKRMLIVPVATIQEFTFQATKIIDRHLETPKKDRPPLMLCLDSLGMLSTSKEVSDIAEGKETRDMTRAQLIRGTFRVLTLKLGKGKIPMLVSNHVYLSVGSMFPTSSMSGGQGVYYAADQILFLSKRKEKDGTEIIGNIIHCKMQKSRLSKENKQIDVLLDYSSGISKYYGLLEFAERKGIIKKIANRYEFPDGSKLYAKQALKDPEKHFTKELMDKIDLEAKIEFTYGVGGPNSEDLEENDPTGQEILDVSE